MGIRRKARILALNTLYQSELNATPAIEKFELLCENFEVTRKSIPYARELITGISENWEKINTLVHDNAANWRIERMAVIDRNIMRIAVYEMCYKDDVPPSVAINEAIEIAKQYCSDDAASFINGILDSISKSRNGR